MEEDKKKANGQERHFFICRNASTTHKGKDCYLKKEHEGPSTIPDIAKTQVNAAHQADIPLSDNANTIHSLQAILNKLLLEQNDSLDCHGSLG